MGSSVGARRPAWWSLSQVAVIVLLILPAPAAAQEPVKSFDQLNSRLQVGETVWVIDAQGRETNGRIVELHDSSITLDDPVRKAIPADRVREIRHRRPDSKWTGALIGFGAGAVYGYVTEGHDCGGDAECLAYPGLYGGLGMLIGAVVDGLIPGKKVAVYRAQGAASARLSIAPFVTPRAKGVAVSFAF